MDDISGHLYLLQPMTAREFDNLERCGAKVACVNAPITIATGDELDWYSVESAEAMRILRRELDANRNVGFCFKAFEDRIIKVSLNEPLRIYYWTAPDGPAADWEIEQQSVHKQMVSLATCCGLKLRDPSCQSTESH